MSDVDKLGDFLGLPSNNPKRTNHLLQALQANEPPIEEPQIEVLGPVEPAAARPITQEKSKDFDEARKNIQAVISTGMESMEHLASLALASENPKAYDTLAKTIQVLVNANRDLVKLHQEKEVTEIMSNANAAGGVTQNNMFVGTTTDLMKMLVNARKNT